MANKKNWSGILVISLVLGMSVVGCDSPTDSTGTVDSSYSVYIDISASNSSAYANAYIYNQDYKFVQNATITIDGITLSKQTYGGYFASLDKIWSQGSTYQYSIITPIGINESGTITKPNGSLTGVIYNPSSPTVAESYTVSPPGGQWPSGSYIHCTVENNGSFYGYVNRPSGTTVLTVTDQDFVGATSVRFYSALEERINFTEYTGYISVTGDETSW
jgi:hypothetical protein